MVWTTDTNWLASAIYSSKSERAMWQGVQQLTRSEIRRKPSFKTASQVAAEGTKEDTGCHFIAKCSSHEYWGGGGRGVHMLTVDWCLHNSGSSAGRIACSIAQALYTDGWQHTSNLQTPTNNLERSSSSTATVRTKSDNAVKLLPRIRHIPGSNTGWGCCYPNEVFQDFPQYFQANTGAVQFRPRSLPYFTIILQFEAIA
jgi:hypothetical protein